MIDSEDWQTRFLEIQENLHNLRHRRLSGMKLYGQDDDANDGQIPFRLPVTQTPTPILKTSKKGNLLESNLKDYKNSSLGFHVDGLTPRDVQTEMRPSQK